MKLNVKFRGVATTAGLVGRMVANSWTTIADPHRLFASRERGGVALSSSVRSLRAFAIPEAGFEYFATETHYRSLAGRIITALGGFSVVVVTGSAGERAPPFDRPEPWASGQHAAACPCVRTRMLSISTLPTVPSFPRLAVDQPVVGLLSGIPFVAEACADAGRQPGGFKSSFRSCGSGDTANGGYADRVAAGEFIKRSARRWVASFFCAGSQPGCS
jgi:hypothetical protein